MVMSAPPCCGAGGAPLQCVHVLPELGDGFLDLAVDGVGVVGELHVEVGKAFRSLEAVRVHLCFDSSQAAVDAVYLGVQPGQVGLRRRLEAGDRVEDILDGGLAHQGQPIDPSRAGATSGYPESRTPRGGSRGARRRIDVGSDSGDKRKPKAAAASSAAWSVQFGSPEWRDAERKCKAAARSYNLGSVADDVVADALVEASRTYRGDNNATFSSLAVTICLHALSKKKAKAADELPEDVAATDGEVVPPPKTARVDSAYGRAFERFFGHEKMMVESFMFEERRAELPRWLRLELGPAGFLAHALRDEGLAALHTTFPEDFDAAVIVHADGLVGLQEVMLPDGTITRHWVESAETMNLPMKTVGRSKPDPYAARLDRRQPAIYRAAVAAQRDRHAGLIFQERREATALAIIRHAMKLAGIGGTFIHQATAGLRAERTREEQAGRRELLRVASRAMATSKRTKP